MQEKPAYANWDGAYATPTIVHFGTVLLLSAVLSAPWHGIRGASLVWGVVGLCGLAYTIVVTRRLRRTAYRPVFEDWLFHALLPFAAYAMLTASGCLSRAYAHRSMFGVAVAALMLLFSGIHNAWDAVTYHVFVKKREHEEPRSHPH